MAVARSPPERGGGNRIGPAIGVAVVHGLIGYVLIVGLGEWVRHVPSRVPLAPIVMTLTLPAPDIATPPPPREPTGHGRAAKSLAPLLPSKRAAVPAPAPPSPVTPTPDPVIPQLSTGGGANLGEESGGGGNIGSGEVAGVGDGSGKGRGDGNGNDFSEARQIGGRFRNSDFPLSLQETGRLTIGVRYAVGPTGRVVSCEIIDTSGYPEVDAMTCRVIVERYRFRPARDGDGIAITEVMEENYTWFSK